MCDPLSLGAIALSTAGSYYSGQTQANYMSEVNNQNEKVAAISRKARQDELERQKAHERDATGSFKEALAGMDRSSEEASTEEGAQSFIDTLDGMDKPTAGEQGFLLPGQGESSVAVKDWVAKSANKSASEAAGRIKALASMTGRGSAQGQRVGTMADANSQIGTINGLRRGSLGVSQFEQNIPSAVVTPGTDILGPLLSGAGMLMGSGFLGGPTAAMPNQGSIFDLYKPWGPY